MEIFRRYRAVWQSLLHLEASQANLRVQNVVLGAHGVMKEEVLGKLEEYEGRNTCMSQMVFFGAPMEL